jgi:hypothetical protein
MNSKTSHNRIRIRAAINLDNDSDAGSIMGIKVIQNNGQVGDG